MWRCVTAFYCANYRWKHILPCLSQPPPAHLAFKSLPPPPSCAPPTLWPSPASFLAFLFLWFLVILLANICLSFAVSRFSFSSLSPQSGPEQKCFFQKRPLASQPWHPASGCRHGPRQGLAWPLGEREPFSGRWPAGTQFPRLRTVAQAASPAGRELWGPCSHCLSLLAAGLRVRGLGHFPPDFSSRPCRAVCAVWAFGVMLRPMRLF